MAYVYAFVTVMQLMPQLNRSDLLRRAQYQHEEYLLYFTRHYKIPVYLLAFALQLTVSLIEISTNKQTLFSGTV
jgi:phosphopantetheinyl transferase